MRASRFFGVILGAGALVLVSAGCAGGDGDPAATTTAPLTSGEAVAGDLTVYAAASLATAFDELATRFEEQHPSVDVQPITYDGSSTLATQIIEGAPADVFASADEKNMQKVVDAGLAGDPMLFATNTLVLVVPAGDPGGVQGLSDLADPSRTVVLCAPEVPCGAASAALLSRAGVEPRVDSYEQNVTAVLAKVAAGEADAGLVYVTDVATSDAVDALDVPGADDVVNRYPVATLTDAANPQAADAFVAFVRSDEGRRVLAGLGFGAP
ncbi:molybdate ABC transporter substrate-binding protein [Microbacterium timonense]|uniref:molybdate ABC transporter substrate-binding protein n=1 Tax=Microbacterium timonense TaxID=2086576 RepID=UPI000D0FABBA|nr:molybdate ABC transporter substrate-binding protein [Microbacterium timonense]